MAYHHGTDWGSVEPHRRCCSGAVLHGVAPWHGVMDGTVARRSVELGDILLEAYRTPTGIPRGTLNLQTLAASNPSWAAGASGLSEFGSEQMEMLKLSEVAH